MTESKQLQERIRARMIEEMEYHFLQQNILEVLKLGPMRRKRIVELVNRPRSTVYYHLKTLIEKKLVEKYTFKEVEGTCGRPWTMYRLNKQPVLTLNQFKKKKI